MGLVLKRHGGPLGLFLALTLVMTNPLVLHLASAVEDKRDALLNTWIIAWVGHALTTDPAHLFDANIFYPYQNTLAFSETLLPQGLIALPITFASGNPVLGYNLVLLGSFLLAAFAMYLFVFDLTRHRGAAVVAGTIFAFNPFNLGNLAQVQLLSFGWLPLALLFLRRLMQPDGKTKDEVPSRRIAVLVSDVRNPALFGLFLSLQALSSIYFGFLAAAAVALYVAWRLGTQLLGRLRHTGAVAHPFLRVTARLAVGLALAVLILLPVMRTYLSVQSELGFQRKIEDSEPFSASLKQYAEVSPQNVAYGGWLAPRPPVIAGDYPLDNLFPGLIALGLAAIALLRARERDRWFYLLLLLLAFVLSLGPRLFVTPSTGTGISLPYRWLYDALPLTHAFRAPVRFDALAMLAMSVLAGMGLAAIVKAPGAGGNLKLETGVSAFAVAVIVLEYLAVPAAQVAPVPTGRAIPQYVQWLAHQPPTTILELPMLASNPAAPLDLTTQYLSTFHWQRTPDGYNGFNPPKRGEIAYDMQFLPDERSLSLLQALGVEYVVVHRDQMPSWNNQRSLPADLRLVQELGNDSIYRVEPRAQNPAALSASLYLPNPAAPSQTFFAYLIVQNHGARSFAVQPTDLLHVDARWADAAGTSDEQVTAAMPLVTSSVSIVPVRLTAPARASTYRLTLSVSSRATDAWNLSGPVAVRNEEPAHEVVLPARVSLSAPLSSHFQPGESIRVALTWQALNKIDGYYSASVRVVDSQGKKITQFDRQPSDRPMMVWPPEWTSAPDEWTLVLPSDIAPGRYSIQVLVYQANDGVDALLLDDRFAPQDVMTLGDFTVP